MLNDYYDLHESRSELMREPPPDTEECAECGERFDRDEMTDRAMYRRTPSGEMKRINSWLCRPCAKATKNKR